MVVVSVRVNDNRSSECGSDKTSMYKMALMRLSKSFAFVSSNVRYSFVCHSRKYLVFYVSILL